MGLVPIYLEREANDVDLSVSTSNSGADALERLQQRQVDYVASGHGMPDINGLEFLRTVRSEHPDLPFILSIGRSSEEVARNAFRAGATDYMQKDTDTDQYIVLANRVVNAVSRYYAKAASERHGTTVEMLDNGVYSLDSTGRSTSADGVFCGLADYDREMTISHRLIGLVAETIDGILSTLERVASPNAPDTERSRTILSPGPAYPHDDDFLYEGRLALRPTEDGESAVIRTLRGVTEHRRWRNQLRYGTRLKDAVLDTPASLMSARTDEIDTKIEWTLQSVGRVVDPDHCPIYLYDDGMTVAARMHDWRDGGRCGHPGCVALEDAR